MSKYFHHGVEVRVIGRTPKTIVVVGPETFVRWKEMRTSDPARWASYSWGTRVNTSSRFLKIVREK